MTFSKEILVLDDEHESAELLASVLGMYLPEASFRVVYSGEDALQAALERLPSVGIFDLEMPGLAGEGAARALRENNPNGQLTLIAISGNLPRLAKLKNDGPFDHVISKPVDVKSLVDAIHAINS